jgi:hypothetical protein
VDSIAAGLRQAARILSHGSNLGSYSWLLVAPIVGQAYNFLTNLPPEDAREEMRLLNRVISELKEASDGFTRPDFLRATGPARPQAPGLFHTNA